MHPLDDGRVVCVQSHTLPVPLCCTVLVPLCMLLQDVSACRSGDFIEEAILISVL